MPATTLLAYIVPKLVVQVENAATDCLYFIFTAYNSAASCFVDYLRRTGADLPDGIKFVSQVSWEHGGTPDLIGFHDKDRVLLIESKFGAPLTKNQPVDYLGQLSRRTDGVLLFVAPSSRAEELWEELAKRCSDSKIVLGKKMRYPHGLVAASVDGNHYLALSTWNGLVACLSEDLTKPKEQTALADLRQFGALCESKNLLLSQTTSDGDKRNQQLRDMVNSIARNLTSLGFARKKRKERYRATPGPGYYKRYMTLSGYFNWCVEYNFEYWARFGESLIWLTTTITPEIAAELTALEIGFPGLSRRIRDQFVIPLKASYSRSQEEALDQMTRQAVAIADSLSATAE